MIWMNIAPPLLASTHLRTATPSKEEGKRRQEHSDDRERHSTGGRERTIARLLPVRVGSSGGRGESAVTNRGAGVQARPGNLALEVDLGVCSVRRFEGVGDLCPAA